jgi:tRNA G46 methylase TrmB
VSGWTRSPYLKIVTPSHFNLWPEFKNQILSIFNAPNVQEQPNIIIELGCGEGLLLRQIYQLIQEHTLRGRRLKEQELRLVGIERTPDLVQAAMRNLADLPAQVVSMSSNCFEPVLPGLNIQSAMNEQKVLLQFARSILKAQTQCAQKGTQ